MDGSEVRPNSLVNLAGRRSKKSKRAFKNRPRIGKNRDTPTPSTVVAATAIVNQRFTLTPKHANAMSYLLIKKGGQQPSKGPPTNRNNGHRRNNPTLSSVQRRPGGVGGGSSQSWRNPSSARNGASNHHHPHNDGGTNQIGIDASNQQRRHGVAIVNDGGGQVQLQRTAPLVQRQQQVTTATQQQVQQSQGQQQQQKVVQGLVSMDEGENRLFLCLINRIMPRLRHWPCCFLFTMGNIQLIDMSESYELATHFTHSHCSNSSYPLSLSSQSTLIYRSSNNNAKNLNASSHLLVSFKNKRRPNKTFSKASCASSRVGMEVCASNSNVMGINFPFVIANYSRPR